LKSRKPLIVIFLTIFLDLLGFGLVLPLLPLYAEGFRASPLMVTSISASYSLMQFLFVPIWGRLSDRVGRRPILLISIAGALAAYLLMGFSRSLTGLFIARILSGIAGANLSVAQAYIADITRPEDRAKGMGLVGAAFGLGFIFGPFIGGTLSSLPAEWLPASLSGWRSSLPFFAAALLAAVNLISAYAWLPESRQVPGSQLVRARPGMTWTALARAMAHPHLGWLMAIMFFTTFAFANMESTFVLWMERALPQEATATAGDPAKTDAPAGLDPGPAGLDMEHAARDHIALPPGRVHHVAGSSARRAGMLFAYIGVLMVALQGGLIGWFTRRFGERRLVAAGTLLMTNGLLLAPLCHSIAPLLGVLALLAVGSGLCGPALQSLISRRTDADDQGGVLGLNQSLSSLARVVGPLTAGFVFGRFGPSAPWLTGGLLMGATCVVAIWVLLLRKETPETVA
jgi:MFS transporter, DHA1 family, tetracycline resistance protein